MKKLFCLPLLCLTLLMGSWTDRKDSRLLLVDGNEKVHILISGKVDVNIFKNGFESWDILLDDEAVQIHTFTFVFAPKRGDAVAYAVNIDGKYATPPFMEKVGEQVKPDDRIILADIVGRTKDGLRNLPPLIFTIQ